MSAASVERPRRDDLVRRARAADYERSRYQQKRSGTWAPFTPTQLVRDHLEDLRAAGMSQEQIARAGGVSVATLHRAAKAPRMSTAAADAILSVQPVQADPAAGASQALRALVAGWTLQQLAEATGLSDSAVSRIANGRTTPQSRNAAAIADVYEVLRWEDPGDGTAALRSRLRAERAGWEPSTALPDVNDVDDIAVDRVVAGEALPLRAAEREVALARMSGRHPDAEIAQRLGVSDRTVLRRRATDQLPAYRGRHPQDTPTR